MNRGSWMGIGAVAVIAVIVAWWLMPGPLEETSPATAPDRVHAPEKEPEAPVAAKKEDPVTPELRATTSGEADLDRDRRLRLDPGELAARSRTLDLARMRQRPTGPFDASESGLQAAIDARTPDLNSCFKTARFHDAELPGDLDLTVVLEAGDAVGAPVVASARSGLDDASILDGCFTAVFQELVFEGGPATLTRAVTLTAD